jgi:hypothetical protein
MQLNVTGVRRRDQSTPPKEDAKNGGERMRATNVRVHQLHAKIVHDAVHATQLTDVAGKRRRHHPNTAEVDVLGDLPRAEEKRDVVTTRHEFLAEQ